MKRHSFLDESKPCHSLSGMEKTKNETAKKPWRLGFSYASIPSEGCSRMVKKAASFVLGRPSPCDVPQRVRLSCRTPCGLAGQPV